MTKSQAPETNAQDDFATIALATTGLLRIWVDTLTEDRLRRLGELMGLGVNPGVLIVPHGLSEPAEGRIVLVDSQGACETAATIDFGSHRMLN